MGKGEWGKGKKNEEFVYPPFPFPFTLFPFTSYFPLWLPTATRSVPNRSDGRVNMTAD